jgi:hypothetical protein
MTGTVALDAPQLTHLMAFPRGANAVRAIVVHELGHLVGLAHMDDPSELMYDDNVGRLALGPGDREGGGGARLRSLPLLNEVARMPLGHPAGRRAVETAAARSEPHERRDVLGGRRRYLHDCARSRSCSGPSFAFSNMGSTRADTTVLVFLVELLARVHGS